MPPDQDHTDIAHENEEGPIDSILKAKLFSLESEVKITKSRLVSMESDVRTRNDEIISLQDRNTDLLKDLKSKDEAMGMMDAKVISLEEAKTGLEARVIKYGEYIISMKNPKGKNSVQPDDSFRKVLKQKNTKIKEYESTIKSMVDKISQFQYSENHDNFEKLKKETEDRKRDLKKSKDELRKAEDRNKTLLKNIDSLNKNISSIENDNTRLKLINSQAKEVVEKGNTINKESIETPTTTQGTWKC